MDHPNVLPLRGIYFGMGPLPAAISPWCANGDICAYLAKRQGESNIGELKLRLVRIAVLRRTISDLEGFSVF